MSDAGLYEWMALRRVHDGGMAKSAGTYLDHGRPTPEYLIGVFDRLIWIGLVTAAGGDPLWELRRLSLTDLGQARYAALGEQRQAGLVVPPPEFGTTQTPVGHRSSRPRLPATDRTPRHELVRDAVSVRAAGRVLDTFPCQGETP